MADPATLLAELQAAGLSLRRQGERLLVKPAGLLSEEHRKAIVTYRAELLELVVDEDAVDLLAQLDPDWSKGPVQIMEAFILRWPDGTPLGAVTAEEMAAIDRWKEWVKTTRQAEAALATDVREKSQARRRKQKRPGASGKGLFEGQA